MGENLFFFFLWLASHPSIDTPGAVGCNGAGRGWGRARAGEAGREREGEGGRKPGAGVRVKIL